MAVLLWLGLSLLVQVGLVVWKLIQGWAWGYLIILEIPALVFTIVGLVVALILTPGTMGTRQ